MKRSGFKPKFPERRPERQWEGPAPVLERPRATLAPVVAVAKPVVVPKTPGRVQQSIRDSARGEECLVRIPGCPADPAMTIWSHAPLKAADKGMGLKALDPCGAYCCTYCDAVVDGQRSMPSGYTRELVMLDWFMGHMRSLVRLRQKGLI